MIAMAIACEPKLLIADEPTTALDVTIQKQILDLIAELQKRHQMSVLFITHDLAVVGEIADHVVVMRNGEIREQGTGEADLRGAAATPTPRRCCMCRPQLDRRPMRLPVIDDFMNGSRRAADDIDRSASAASRPSDPIVLDVQQPRQELLFARGALRQARVQGGEGRVVPAAARARRSASSANRAPARRRSGSR